MAFFKQPKMSGCVVSFIYANRYFQNAQCVALAVCVFPHPVGIFIAQLHFTFTYNTEQITW